MSTPQWSPSATVSGREQWLLKRLVRTKKLFAFLRLHRHELFDDALYASGDRERRDRRIVNGEIAVVNAEIGNVNAEIAVGERRDRGA